MKISEIADYEGPRAGTPFTWADLVANRESIQPFVRAWAAGGRLYRGAPPEQGKLIDPSTSERKSRNTDNFYTWIIDNSPRWKRFPKRSRSFICTNREEIAQNYSGFGDANVVVPIGNPVIGITDQADFWLSFPYLKSQADVHELSDLNSVLNSLYREYFGVDLRHVAKSWPELVAAFAQLTKLNLTPDTVRSLGQWRDEMIKGLLQHGPDLLKTIDALLSPHKNQIKVDTVSNLAKYRAYTQELWISAPCYNVNVLDWERDWKELLL